MAKKKVKRKFMAACAAAAAIVSLGFFGIQLDNYISSNAAATTEISSLQKIKNLLSTQKTDNDPLFCFRDANNDDSVQFYNKQEFFLTGADNCVNSGGAPGITILTTRLSERISGAQPAQNDFNLAAAYYSTGNIGDGTVKTMNTTVNQDTSAPIQYPNSTQNSTYYGSQKPTTGNFIGAVTLRNLSKAELSGINADRRAAGLSGLFKKRWKRGVYECTDFARDLEKTNPSKYTITVTYCRIDLTCRDKKTGKTHSMSIIGGHAYNDVHSGPRQISYVEPQTGKNIDPDLDGDGKASNNEKFHIPGVSEQIDIIMAERAPDCTEDIKITTGPLCTTRHFEDMNQAYSSLPKNFFHSNFNPN